MPPDRLAALQRRFFGLITAPEGVAPALPALAAADPDGVPLRRWIAAPDDELARVRLDVYADMYFYRLLDALREDYPKTVALLGDARFHNLVTDYLLAHPSDHPSLRHLGRHLPAFLGGHALAADRPALADLAALEWARSDAFDAPDAAPLAAGDLAALAPDQWAELRLAVVPAARTLRLGWPAHELWAALERGGAPPPLEPAPTGVLVWRQALRVYHRAAEPGELDALALLADGAPFGALCAELAGDDGDVAAAAERAFALLWRWLGDGLLAAPAGAPG